MRLNKLVGVGLLVLMPSMSMAQGIGNTVDVYYVDTDTTNTVVGIALEGNGDGYGAKGVFAIADNWFLSGEYHHAESDLDILPGSVTVRQVRLGGGYNTPLSAHAEFYAQLEYIRADVDWRSPFFSRAKNSENGYGAHAGLMFKATDAFGINVRLGYLDIEASGLEYLIGATYQITRNFGLFADYRVSNLSQGSEDMDINDLRIGVRFSF